MVLRPIVGFDDYDMLTRNGLLLHLFVSLAMLVVVDIHTCSKHGTMEALSIFLLKRQDNAYVHNLT